MLEPITIAGTSSELKVSFTQSYEHPEHSEHPEHPEIISTEQCEDLLNLTDGIIPANLGCPEIWTDVSGSFRWDAWLVIFEWVRFRWMELQARAP
jgi:hypothetical protein